MAANAHSCPLCGELPSAIRNHPIWEPPSPLPHPSPWLPRRPHVCGAVLHQRSLSLPSSPCPSFQVRLRLAFSPSPGCLLDPPTTQPIGSLGLSCWLHWLQILILLYDAMPDGFPGLVRASDGSSGWLSGLEEHVYPRVGLNRDPGGSFPCCIIICHPVITH